MVDETAQSTNEMIAYYDRERRALQEQVKAGHLKTKNAGNGTLYFVPLSTGEEIVVAMVNANLVIRSGDSVMFKRGKSDGGDFEATMKVGDLEIDENSHDIEFRRDMGGHNSLLRLQDATANISAMGRQRIQAMKT